MRGLVAVLAFMALGCATVWAQQPEQGLSAKYPRDAGIDKDPAVIFASGFEQGFNGWTAFNPKVSSIVNDPGILHSGRVCAMTVATKDQDEGGDIKYHFPKGYDQVYLRFYCKFAKDSYWPHHFVKIQAHKPGFWGNAGTRPPGDQGFWTGIEPMSIGKWHFYTYWYQMHSWKPAPTGDGKDYYGNSFAADDQPEIPKDQWVCVEAMLKANTVGKSDGEQAYWMDGKLLGEWKPGTPVGSWIRDKFVTSGQYNTNPHPFEGYDFRTDPTLQINQILLQWYVDKTRKPGQPDRNIIYWDDVVVATKYIGPMTGNGSGSATPGTASKIVPPPGWDVKER